MSYIIAILALLAQPIQTAAATDTAAVIIHTPAGSTHTIYAEIAATRQQQQRGLSHRHKLADNQGMLFVFNPPKTDLCLWMKDTYIPLTAMFLGKNNNILTKTPMQPQTTTRHCAPKDTPIKYIIEITPNMANKIPIDSRLTIRRRQQ